MKDLQASSEPGDESAMTMRRKPLARRLPRRLAASAALRPVALIGVLLCLTTTMPVFGSPLMAAASNEEGLPSLAPIIEDVLPGVVNISTETRVQVQQNPLLEDPFFRRFFELPDEPQERERSNLGSGVIIDADQGFVITNAHVVEDATEITVTLRDGRQFQADLKGADPEVDLALLQIEGDELTEVSFGDSDALRVGDFVVAIGNPFSLSQTVTSGIVSALGRSNLGIVEGYEDFIQTDASINPGNSGGALINLKGELVGIPTAIVGGRGGNIGIGFAIPSNMAQQIIEQLIEYGEVRRGQLGVYIQDLTPELAEVFGVEPRSGAAVTQVIPGTPADEAGLESGDVITAVDGESVSSASELRNAIGLLRAGTTISLTVIREGDTRTIEATIRARDEVAEGGSEARDDSDSGTASGPLAGTRLSPVRSNHPLHGRVEGLQVLEVQDGSRAERAGLRPGDVIVSINRQRVTSLSQARAVLDRVSRPLLLNVRRGEGALFIVIR